MYVHLHTYLLIVHFATLHIVSAIFQIFDHYQILQLYKKKVKDRVTYYSCMPTVLKNQFCLMLPMMLLTEHLGLCFFNISLDYSIYLFVFVSAVMTIGHDLLFYLGHRYILHTDFGFTKLGHNLHHASKANCAISALYMSSVDFFIEIVVPYLVPLCLVSSYTGFYVHVILNIAGTFGGAYEHSGYNFFPNPFDNTSHFMHHHFLKCSFSDGFGSSNIMDFFLKTRYYYFFDHPIDWSSSSTITDSNTSKNQKNS